MTTLRLAILMIPWACWLGCRPHDAQSPTGLLPDEAGIYHVYEGQSIQAALDAAAVDVDHKTVHVHSGTYRPQQPGQAFVRFNRQHDRVQLVGVGKVVFNAANESLADASDAAYPAIVSHIVYFGDGISRETTLRNVTLTGANGFVADDATHPAIEPVSTVPELEKGLFFFRDGGAMKIFGRSYPVIEGVTFRDNFTTLCGGGVSVEHRGFLSQAATFRDCVFVDNRCPGTGSAIDVLGGSAAEIVNCLFVGNVANTGMDQIAAEFGLRYNPQHGCGALTVFPQSKVLVRRCTFTENWNGVDDKGRDNYYLDSIFWQNTAGDGSRPGGAYELDVEFARNVKGCLIRGNISDLQETIDKTVNVFDPPDPQFDGDYIPQAGVYQGVGYRPGAAAESSRQARHPEGPVSP